MQARSVRILALLTAAGTLAAPAVAQTLPTTQCPTLAGGSVAVPAAAHGQVAIFIVGFSRSSKEPTRAWGELAGKTYGGTPGVVIYSAAVLEGVPHLFRGLVEYGIRHSIPPAIRDHFLLVYRHEAGWKAAVGYSAQAPDDGYIAILDPESRVAWRGKWPAKAAADAVSGSATWRDFERTIARLLATR